MKLRKPLLIVLFVLSGLFLQISTAQTFTQFTTSFSGFSQGTAAWADFDQDGYLDVFIHGVLPNSQPSSKLYRNNQGMFQDVNAGIIPLKNGSARWGDFDNDGDPDLLICGVADDYKAKTRLYRNDNGIFTDINAGFAGCFNGMAIWGDYNNDGFIDVVLSGDSLSYSATTLLYKNNGDGTFNLVETILPGSLSSALAFGDYDNDGDLDLVLCGDIGGIYSTLLFRNEEGIFTNSNIFLEGAGAGAVNFFDYDKDMDMDIILMGNDMTLTPSIRLYRNDEGTGFTEIITAASGMALGNIAIGDFDNDGWPDFAATGKTNGCGTSATVLYRNNQAGNFWQSSSSFPDLSYSNVSWADFDNDGDKDLLTIGLNGSGQTISRLYRNSLGSNTYQTHTAPSAPMGMTANVQQQNVVLSWNKAIDDNCPSKSLSYNLRVGINPGMMEIMSPAADLSNGSPRIYDMGNVSQDTSWTLKNLREGTYYWSIQACDHSFKNSEFTEEGSFEISINVGLGEHRKKTAIYPNPAKDEIRINSGAEGNSVNIRILTADGSIVFSETTHQDVITKNITHLPSGLYFVQITSKAQTETHKLIVK